MRIDIVGLPGSGKTTLAEAISKKLAIPHIHLDRFWFDANGLEYKKDSKEELDRVRAVVRKKTLEAIAGDAWVSDGIYLHVQPEIVKRVGIIIFLDIPLWERMLNHARRIFNPSTRHTELNILHEMSFFLEIIRRQFKSKSKLDKFISENKEKVVALKSREEIKRYLAGLG